MRQFLSVPRFGLVLCAVAFMAAATAAPALAGGKPVIQTLHVDQTTSGSFDNACSDVFDIHEVGTIRTTTFPNGSVTVEQNEQLTATSLETGKSADYSSVLKVTGLTVETLFDQGRTVTATSTFSGMNYRFANGTIIAAGRGRGTATYTFDASGRLIDFQVDEHSTPQFQHLGFTLCQLLSDRPTGDSAIAGTVKDAQSGKPVAGECVSAWTQTGDFANWALTDSTGAYKIVLLPAGTYSVAFFSCNDGLYVPQWKSPVQAYAHRTTLHVDAALTPLGRITGLVTADGAGGKPLAGVCIFVESDDGTGYEFSGLATTGLDGRYTVGGLPTGPAKVEFDPSCGNATSTAYAFEWWNDRATEAAADPIAVSVGGTVSGINAGLPLAGSISGTVTADDSHGSLSRICVTGDHAGFAFTDDQGRYTLSGLRPGTYKVHFADCNFPQQRYAGEWYDNVPDNSTSDDVAAATPVLVAPAANRSGIDASLAVGSVISGRVTEAASGSPLGDVCVTAYLLDHAGAIIERTELSPGAGQTGPDGRYRVTGLSTGRYKIDFADCDGVYAEQWWHGAASADTANVVTVSTLGAETSNVDAALAVGLGGLSGRVTDAATGQPLGEICVSFYEADTGYFVGTATTGPDGTYRTGFGEIPSTAYEVEFSDCLGTGGFADQWYDGRADFDSATPIPFTVGTLVRNINAAMTV